MSGWLIIGIVAIAAAFLLMRRSKTPQRSAHRSAQAHGSGATAAERRAVKRSTESVDQFRGVTVVPQADACAAALNARKRTFPAANRPQLPLSGCDRESCSCELRDVGGRRRGERRVSPDRRGEVRFGEDRRKGKDRRAGADAWKRAVD